MELEQQLNEHVLEMMRHIIDNAIVWENEFGTCNKISPSKKQYTSTNDFRIHYHIEKHKVSFKILPVSNKDIIQWHSFDGNIPNPRKKQIRT
jgi:hypothetical protein